MSLNGKIMSYSESGTEYKGCVIKTRETGENFFSWKYKICNIPSGLSISFDEGTSTSEHSAISEAKSKIDAAIRDSTL